MHFSEGVWDLGRGTQLRILEMGEVKDRPDGSGELPLDIKYVERGRLSQWAIKKKLKRMVGAMLVLMIAEEQEKEGAFSSWGHRAMRERRWLTKNIHLVH